MPAARRAPLLDLLADSPRPFGSPTPPLFDDTRSASIDIAEAVSLGAIDSEFFNHTFFPKTFRQSSPPFHREMDSILENPHIRLANLRCFRGSAKTTKLRAFVAKRIAYRISRTILFIAASEPKAAQSVTWTRNQIERNRLYASTFGLRRGNKWHETELEIISDVDGTTTWLLGVGITGSLRGVNFDDYRPDLIVLDDTLTDENTLTAESRQKTTDLILGAVVGSLISEVDEPNAKLVMCQTPLHDEDTSSIAAKSPTWSTVEFGCWSRDSIDLPDAEKLSSWPEYYPTASLRQRKLDFIEMGQLHIFLREYEVRLAAPGAERLHIEHLQFYPDDMAFRGGSTIISVDPVPAPTDRLVAKGLHDKDYEAIVVQTRLGPNYYLREYRQRRGHDPTWTVGVLFELSLKYRPTAIVIESVAFASTLKWFIEKEMIRMGQYWPVLAATDSHKKKFVRIVNAFTGVCAARRYFVRRAHSEFLSDFATYPKVSHDDLLDAAATGLITLVSPSIELAEDEFLEVDEDRFEPLDRETYSHAP